MLAMTNFLLLQVVMCTASVVSLVVECLSIASPLALCFEPSHINYTRINGESLKELITEASLFRRPHNRLLQWRQPADWARRAELGLRPRSRTSSEHRTGAGACARRGPLNHGRRAWLTQAIQCGGGLCQRTDGPPRV